MGIPVHSITKSGVAPMNLSSRDSDFWMKDNFFDKIYGTAQEAISSIDRNLQKLNKSKGRFENFRRRGFL